MGIGMAFDFADLLMEVVARKASDLHLTAGARPTLRVRGRLTQLEEYEELSPADTREIVYSILTGEQRQRLETDWQIDFAYSIPGHARFRVNAYYQRSAIGAAFRLIPFGLTSIDDLGLPPTVHEFTRKPRGLVLVTGPTGSGKSTTLAAMIDQINQTREEHILTIEDPIEFLHPHKRCLVNQREVGSDAQSFSAALTPRCARTPTSSWSARCATWRRSPPRSPPPRPAIWSSPLCTRRTRPDDRPHHRRLPAAPAGAGARAALGRAAGRRLPAAAAAADGRAAWRRARSSCRARPCAT